MPQPSIMEKDIPSQIPSNTMFNCLRQTLSPPYFKRSERRQQRFQQLPVQVEVTPMDYESLSLGQALKKWRRISWITLALAMNILLWGFDGGIVGNLSSMPNFQ